MIKRKNNFLPFDLFLIMCGVVIILCKHSYLLLQDINEDRQIKVFLKEQKTINKEISIPNVNEETNVTHTSSNYIVLIKIPKINLEKVLCNINSKCNNVNQNIQILKEDDYPDIENGNFILAGHSGTRYISYFKNLDKLVVGDNVSILFNGYEYRYEIKRIYDIEKTGTADIVRNQDKTTLTLITCRHNTNKQIIIICELIERI